MAWGWPEYQWAAHLLPLLLGEAQLVTELLLVGNMLDYLDLNQVIFQLVIHTPE